MVTQVIHVTQSIALAEGGQAHSPRDCPPNDVTLVEGATTDATLRESRGASLDVEVVDARGRPLPFARLAFHEGPGFAYVTGEGGVQRVDGFTDERGRLHLARVQPGARRVRVSWGGRHALERLSLEDGERRRVRIVLD